LQARHLFGEAETRKAGETHEVQLESPGPEHARQLLWHDRHCGPPESSWYWPSPQEVNWQAPEFDSKTNPGLQVAHDELSWHSKQFAMQLLQVVSVVRYWPAGQIILQAPLKKE